MPISGYRMKVIVAIVAWRRQCMMPLSTASRDRRAPCRKNKRRNCENTEVMKHRRDGAVTWVERCRENNSYERHHEPVWM